eukprot:tig00021108_g18320.t1
MIVVQPEWVTHAGNAIWSIDIHPDGTRLATAGGDSTIKIWSTAVLFDEEKKSGDEGTVELCVIKNHQAGVNCVRWSHNGRYLASASDDLNVGVFERKAMQGFGGSEMWGAVQMMRGHKMDISDLAWSPDDRYIATASFDSTVIVWDAERFTQLAQLGSSNPEAVPATVGHTGWVQGLAWDPLGKYLASQGADKTVIVWRSADWSAHEHVRKPFRNAIGSILFRRLSWSPDGEYVATTNAFKKPSHVASILARSKGFEVSHDFVGHETPVVVARFNPVIFRRESAEGEVSGYTVCAVGSQDAMISVWATHSTRPIVIAQDLFGQSIVDIAWSPDGYTLACCAADGGVALFRFKAEELGQPLSADERARILSSLYGDIVGVGAGAPAPLVETPDLLSLEQRAAARRAERASAGPDASALDSPPASRPALAAPVGTSQQIESRTRDGRRRITPQVLASVPLPAAASSLVSSPSSQPNVAPPRAASPAQPGPSGSAAGAGPTALSLGLGPLRPAPAPGFGSPPPQSQRPSASPPVAASSSTGPPPVFSGPSSAGKAPGEHAGVKRKGPPVGPAARMAAHVRPALRRTIAAADAARAHTGAGRERRHVAGAGEEGTPRADRVSAAGAQAARAGRPLLRLRRRRRLRLGPAEAGQAAPAARAGPLLAAPPLKATLNRQLMRTPGYIPPPPPTAAAGAEGAPGAAPGGAAQADGMTFLEVSVAPLPAAAGGAGAGFVSTLRCVGRGALLWTDRVYARACAVAGNTGVFAACAFDDGSLSVYSPAGRRVMPPLALGAQAVVLESSSGAHLLAVTAQARVWLWDVARRACLMEGSAEALLACAPPGTSVERGAVEEATGAPVLTLSTGESFLWSAAMRAWLRVADAQGLHSDFFTTAPHGIGSEGRGLLAALQARAAQQAGVSGALLSAGRAHQTADTISHLEAMLASAEAVQAAGEYRRWVKPYARRLAEAADPAAVAKLRELCDSLLGPHADAGAAAPPAGAAPAWRALLFPGLPKRQVLEEDVLPQLATTRAVPVQRLFADCRAAIDALKARAAAAGGN